MPVLAAVILIILVATTARAQETRMVPVTVDGERVPLQMRVYPPTTDTPAPTLVFNHGSTGTGTNPEAFARPLDFPEVARFFVARGWAVVIPARRGRGGSEGHYDEGFWPNRSWGYACDPALSQGVITFAGGWNATRSQHAATINQSLFVRGARYPDDTMWIYGDGDLFYSLAHSRANFAAFQSAGGQGAFHELPTETGGHYLWRRPDRWAPLVESYLKRRGLPSGTP